MAISNITGFTNRSDGNKITASIWNSEIGGIYTYINNNLVTALNTLTSKGDLLIHDGTGLIRLPIGPTNGHNLTIDSAQPAGMKWAPPGGLPLISKGDILVHDGTTLIRVPVGPNGQNLQADSTQAAGVKWAASGAIAQSTDLTIAAGAQYTFVHNLGSMPRHVWYALVCQIATEGYSVGDVVHGCISDVSTAKAISFRTTTTQVDAQVGANNGAFSIVSRLTGNVRAATNPEWKLRIFAQA